MAAPVVDALYGLIATEMRAANQYVVHAKCAQNWGYPKLDAKFREISIEEMNDIELYMDRVLLLGGLPNLQRLDAFMVGGGTSPSSSTPPSRSRRAPSSS